MADGTQALIKRVLSSKYILPSKYYNKKGENLFRHTNWTNALSELLILGGASEGNRVTLYTEGDDAYTDMWASIVSARKRVWWEAYTVEPDSVGMASIGHLLTARQAGCDVILLYDSFGSSGLRHKHIQPLIDAGSS